MIDQSASAEVIRPGIVVPDPTTLTTEQLHRAIRQLHDLIDARFVTVARDIAHIKDTGIERLLAIRMEIEAVRVNIVERSTDRDARTALSAAAVADALSMARKAAEQQTMAADNAIAKAETNIVRQIDAIVALINNTMKATEDKIADLKGRIDRGEGGTQGGREERTDRRQESGAQVTMISAAIMGLSLLLSVLGFAALHH